MIKNAIIVIQAVMLAFVTLWAYFYKHRADQILIIQELTHYAVEARFKIMVAERIDAGDTEKAKSSLRNVAATNVEWAKEGVEKLDLDMKDLASDANKVATQLDEVGVPDLLIALEERKKVLQE